MDEAIRATPADTDDDVRDVRDDERLTRRALTVLESNHNDAYEVALGMLREDTQEWWAEMPGRAPHEMEDDEEPATAEIEGLRRFLEAEVLPWF